MNAKQKIEELQKQIEVQWNIMKNCHHEFKEPIYDPEINRQGYGGRYVGHGSDPSWEFDGYHTVEKPRWARECKICGHKDYTYTNAPVITGYAPKF